MSIELDVDLLLGALGLWGVNLLYPLIYRGGWELPWSEYIIFQIEQLQLFNGLVSDLRSCRFVHEDDDLLVGVVFFLPLGWLRELLVFLQ